MLEKDFGKRLKPDLTPEECLKVLKYSCYTTVASKADPDPNNSFGTFKASIAIPQTTMAGGAKSDFNLAELYRSVAGMEKPVSIKKGGNP